MRLGSAVLNAVVLGTLAAAGVGAQQSADWDPGRIQMSRAALEALLARLDSAAESPVYSEALQAQSRRERAFVRRRLSEGDFQVGDRIDLQVEGEPTLTATFTVDEGRIITVPTIGAIPLSGVLHSELRPHLAQYIGRFVKKPIVHARALIRISVLGEVNRPGFYLLPTEMLVDEALMAAGGPTREAKLTEVRVERGDERLWEGEAMQQAITEGRTLDRLGVRAGDHLVVPQRPSGGFDKTFRIFTLVVTISTSVYTLSHIF